MTVPRLLAALGVVALTVAARPAHAQTPAVDPRTDAKMHLGPVFLTPVLQIQQLGIDTNVFNSVADPKSDFTVTFAPQVSAWLPIASRALISTNSTLGFVYFKKYASERSVDPTVSVRGELFLHRLNPFVEVGLSHSRERPNFEIDARSRRNDTSLRTGVNYRLTPKLKVRLDGYTQDFRYDINELFLGTNLRESLQRNERGFGVGVTYALTVKTAFVVSGETRRARFDFSPRKNADGFKLVGGFSLAPRALISGNIEAGVRHFDPLSSVLEGYTGLVAKASLGYTALGSTRFGLTMDRDVSYSYEPTQPYYLVNGIGGSIRRQLVRKSDVILDARRHKYSYRTFGDAVSSLAGREDSSRVYSIDLGYRLNAQSRAGLVVSKTSRVSNTVNTRDYNGIRFGFSVTYGPQ